MKRRSGMVTLSLFLGVFDSGSSNEAVHQFAMAQARKDPAIVLPKVRHTPPESAAIGNKSVVVSIVSETEIYLGKERVGMQELAVGIRDALYDKDPRDQWVFIRCGPAIQFGTVRQVFNVSRQIGYDRLGLVVQSTDGGAAVFAAMIFQPIGFKLDPRDQITVPPRKQPSSKAPPPPPPPPPPRPNPRAKAVPLEPLPSDALVVEVKSVGTGLEQATAVNTKPFPLYRLRTILGDLLEIRPDKMIFVKPSRDRSYGDIIAVADEITGAGGYPLAILIDDVAVPRGIPRPTNRPPAINIGPGGVPGGAPGAVLELPPIKDPLIRKSTSSLQSSATHRVQATTPEAAKRAKVSGTVVVEVTVDEEGKVISAHAISGHALLKDAAISAARQWKFEPMTLQGVPAKVVGTLSFVFK